MMNRVEIKGLREMKKAFERVGKEALKEFETASLEIGQVVLTGARALAPGPTGRKSGKWAHAPGNLKEKIRLKKPTERDKNKARVYTTVGFGAGAAYGVPVELGHKLKINGKVVGYVGPKPGGTGFLRPAADRNKTMAHERFEQALNAALDQWIK